MMGPDSRTTLLASLLSLLLAGAALGAPGAAHAQDDGDDDGNVETSTTSGGGSTTIGGGKDVGLGLGTGLFTSGLTGKFYLDNESAIQAFIGDFGHYGRTYCSYGCGFSLSVDYVNEFSTLAEADPGRLFLGAGGGGAIYSPAAPFTGVGFAANALVELGWHFKDFPLELVLDLRAAFDFGPFADLFFIHGGGAIRFYF